MVILYKQLQFLVIIFNTNNLHIVIWFKVFLSDINNFQIDLFAPQNAALTGTTLPG